VNPWIKYVKRFHEKFGQPVLSQPTISEDRLDLRVRLMREELQETVKAMWDEDMVEIADGLADLLYVTIGTALEYGIDLDPIFEEVHRSNMAKLPGNLRPDGKIMKPANWKPPQIATLLEKQMNKGAKKNVNG
jgi:predicted HAD superfamily Cof-like phosphohydrolase